MKADTKFSFDDRCYELAVHFYPTATANELDELAQQIQDLVESSPLLEKYPG